jgi:hypothetical protein
MNDLTIIGTITVDRLHFRHQVRESLGGIPWFATELSPNERLKMRIVTNVGKDFPFKKVPKHILKASKINIVCGNTTTLDIFPDRKGVPAIVKNFTGETKNINSLRGKVIIISPLFQEISVKSIKKLRAKFTIMIVDIQGFTRQSFKQNMKLSDDIKTEPRVLPQLCKIADIIKFSENEFDAIMPKLSLEEKLLTLHNLGLKNVIVTQSDKGCIISMNDSQPKILSVKPIRISDTVGAGDKFLILLGTFLAKNDSLEKSVVKAQRKLQTLMREQI